MNIFSHKLPDKGTSSGDAISIISCVLGGSKYLKVLVSGANIIYFPIYELSVSGPLKKKRYMPVTNSLDILHYTVRVAENQLCTRRRCVLEVGRLCVLAGRF